MTTKENQTMTDEKALEILKHLNKVEGINCAPSRFCVIFVI